VRVTDDTRIHVRDLVHHPGVSKDLDTVIPAPADLGLGLARVPEGSDLRIDARLDSLHEGILVSGRLSYRVEAECARCLKPFDWDEEVEFRELFDYDRNDASEPEAEDEPPLVEDDGIDLEQTVRDAVVLDLPFRPICEAYGAGPCEAEGIADPDAAGYDPRWAALSDLLDGHDSPRNEK
jgi:uncharacterized protein